MRRAIALVVLAASTLLAGCGVATSVTGRATKEVPAELFDPCTLSDDVLRSVHVDPATAAADFLGVQSEGWELCSWRSDWYFLSIFTTDTTVEELRARPKNTDSGPSTSAPATPSPSAASTRAKPTSATSPIRVLPAP